MPGCVAPANVFAQSDNGFMRRSLGQPKTSAFALSISQLLPANPARPASIVVVHPLSVAKDQPTRGRSLVRNSDGTLRYSSRTPSQSPPPPPPRPRPRRDSMDPGNMYGAHLLSLALSRSPLCAVLGCPALKTSVSTSAPVGVVLPPLAAFPVSPVYAPSTLLVSPSAVFAGGCYFCPSSPVAHRCAPSHYRAAAFAPPQ